MRYLETRGMKIPFIFEENSDFPIVILKLVFKNCGRSFDEVAGLARVFAKLLNEGVDEDFFKNLEQRAINLEASSGFETLQLQLSCLKEHFDYAVDALQTLLQKPRFEKKILQRITTLLLGELASKNSDFDYVAKNLLNRIVFEYEEFQSPDDGDEKSIAAISLEHLQRFYKKHLNLSNLIVVLGGDLSEKQAEDKILRLLSSLKKGEKISEKKYSFTSKNKDEILQRKDSQQAYIYFASPFLARIKDSDLYLAKIALFILGQGGFGSRILEEIRVKRALAYSAYALLELTDSYQRIFGYLQTKNESAKEAKELVRDIFADFVNKGVSQRELNQAKNFLIGSTPLRYESLSKRLNIALNEYYQGLELGWYKKELCLIEQTNLQELNAYIKKHKELLHLSFASVINEN